jgi:2-oxoacid:acceptor oxidoreductase delta subunit (pyruvate/2-ketoisovalerate family)
LDVSNNSLSEGAVIEGPTSQGYEVSGWRIKKPVINEAKCTNCLICWIYCPEPAIVRHSNSKITIDYDHCKGCGICEEECPLKAISMVSEI